MGICKLARMAVSTMRNACVRFGGATSVVPLPSEVWRGRADQVGVSIGTLSVNPLGGRSHDNQKDQIIRLERGLAMVACPCNRYGRNRPSC